jgi:hypothetical protein
MSQFRTTADILDEVLQEAGEPTNGNSPYETAVLVSANHAHHAIIAGGNIFNLTVDEPWVWARNRFPITLELQAAVTASFTGTADSTAITFSAAPTSSVEGWHLQANGKKTVYKITNHTAGSTTAQIDSGLIETAGSTSRIFKLDYEITPSYFYVDSSNDRINYQEVTASTRTASLTHGTYTPTTFLSQVFAQFTASGTGTVSYGGTYNTTLKVFNMTSSATFRLMGASGGDYKRSALQSLGFDFLDHTGAQSYTSAYPPNAISRLIEPFKIHSTTQQFVYSTDPIRMQQDYPLAYVRETVPTRFCRLLSERDGAVTVRFNSYPKEKTKIQIDWVQRPVDLQDNTASFVALPREDIKTFIYAASAYLLYQKEDSKWESNLKLAGAGLEAMKLKNRALLNRTGENFAQISPRLDLEQGGRKLNYGYTSGGG